MSGSGGARREVGFLACAALVFSSMVGTGVFTSLGFQVGSLPSPFVILVLWATGGAVALCGALSYAELAAALPRSGGEYHFLSRCLHPAVGTMAGFVSVFVGFSAPIALVSMAFGRYAAAAWSGVNPLAASVAVAVGLALVHGVTVSASGRFQVVATALKVCLIVAFLVAGCLLASGADFLPKAGDGRLILSPAFAVSLMYVMYSYSGWNAAVYIAGEVRSPAKVLPRALAMATLAVAGLYVGLNAVFLASAPMSELEGKLEVGEVAARHLLGGGGGRLVSGIIAVGLVSSLSALTWAGPRVAQTAGEDFAALRFFSVRTAGGIPLRALGFQTAVVLAFLFTSTFESVMVYAQFALIVCACLTVASLLVLRIRESELPRPFRCPLVPLVPGVFLAVGGFTIAYALIERPAEAFAGALTLALGAGFFFLIRGKV